MGAGVSSSAQITFRRNDAGSASGSSLAAIADAGTEPGDPNPGANTSDRYIMRVKMLFARKHSDLVMRGEDLGILVPGTAPTSIASSPGTWSCNSSLVKKSQGKRHRARSAAAERSDRR